ncbi:hypothetical protein BC828DRAFT_437374 [Blastocladiella britannica]|nr:hypothetical protein BC828DRAFT_437374 [Blastocladiella britannica]
MTIPIEIVDRVLAFAAALPVCHLPLRLAARVGDPDRLCPLLNVGVAVATLPRTARMALLLLDQGTAVAAAKFGRVDLLVLRSNLGLSLVDNGGSISQMVVHASRGGHVSVLAWLKTHGHYNSSSSAADIGMVADAMAAASEDNFLQVLDWWRTNMAISLARVIEHGDPPVVLLASASAGHLPVMQWWSRHVPQVVQLFAAPIYGQAIARSRQSESLTWWFREYTFDTDMTRRPVTWGRDDQVSFAMTAPMGLLASEIDTSPLLDRAARLSDADRHWIKGFSLAGRTDALDWYCAGRQPMRDVLKQATTGMELWNCPIATLDWWYAKLPRKLFSLSTTRAAYAGRVDVLEWAVVEHGLRMPPFYGTYGSQSEVFENGQLEVLQWLKAHGATIKLKANNFAMASSSGNLAMLDWILAECVAANMVMPCTPLALNLASSRNGNPAVLEWWASRHAQYPDVVPFSHDASAMDRSSSANAYELLEWWVTRGHGHYGHPLLFSDAALKNATDYGATDTLEWWAASGLLLKHSSNVLNDLRHASDLPSLEWWGSASCPLPIKVNPVLLEVRSAQVRRLNGQVIGPMSSVARDQLNWEPLDPAVARWWETVVLAHMDRVVVEEEPVPEEPELVVAPSLGQRMLSMLGIGSMS